MTTVAVPKIIFDLFENEIHDIMIKTVEVCAKASNMSSQCLKEAVEHEFNTKLRIIPIEEEELKIVKKRKKKVLDEDIRCKAFVKKDGIMKQCCFSMNNQNNMYCTRHYKKYGDNIQEHHATPTNEVLAKKIQIF